MSIARITGDTARFLVFFAIDIRLALPAPTPSLSSELGKRTTTWFCSPSDSRLFAKNESESKESAPARS
jgi:hypothetical protein